MSVNLSQIENDLKGAALRDRMAFPLTDAHNPALPIEVRTHTRTVNERADSFEQAAELVGLVADDSSVRAYVFKKLGWQS